MDIEIKVAQGRIDPIFEGNYRYISQMERIVKTQHRHDYFEIFLITKGKVVHEVNSVIQLLTKGALVFIRPHDIHCYTPLTTETVEFVNLEVRTHTIMELFAYLGSGYPSDSLLRAPSPPVTVLSDGLIKSLNQRLAALNAIKALDKEKARTALRVILVEMFSNHFHSGYTENCAYVPQWLEELNTEMVKLENLTQGMDAMRAVSGKSTEHLCRTYQKYFGVTPTRFITELRLDYAAGLLRSTDMTALDIALEIGINNLSHFYKIFKTKFHLAPTQYRRAMTIRKNR